MTDDELREQLGILGVPVLMPTDNLLNFARTEALRRGFALAPTPHPERVAQAAPVQPAQASRQPQASRQSQAPRQAQASRPPATAPPPQPPAWQQAPPPLQPQMYGSGGYGWGQEIYAPAAQQPAAASSSSFRPAAASSSARPQQAPPPPLRQRLIAQAASSAVDGARHYRRVQNWCAMMSTELAKQPPNAQLLSTYLNSIANVAGEDLTVLGEPLSSPQWDELNAAARRHSASDPSIRPFEKHEQQLIACIGHAMALGAKGYVDGSAPGTRIQRVASDPEYTTAAALQPPELAAMQLDHDSTASVPRGEAEDEEGLDEVAAVEQGVVPWGAEKGVRGSVEAAVTAQGV
eukprot:tig00020553_g10707.t1